jgi:AAA family ATP:ADP antiporter
MNDNPAPTRFERLLSMFTRVHAGEGRCIAALCLQAFLLMAAYYLVRPVREALILTDGGAELRSYAVGVQALLLLAVIPIYGWLVRRAAPGRVFQHVNAFFALNLVIFFLLAQAGCRLGFAFFVWVSLFGVMAVAQFWAAATELFNVSTGQRLFGVIAIGVAAGAWAGSQLSAACFEALGAGGLMLAAAAVLSASIWTSGRARRLVPDGSRSEPHTASPGPAAARWLGGFAVVAQSRYLVGIAALVVLLNWITSTGDFVLSSWLVERAGREAPGGESLYIGRFMGNYCAMVTLAAFAIQLLLVSRIILLAGLARALLVTPLAFAAGYLAIGVVPAFLMLQSVLVIQRSLDYSLLNTARHALLLPGSRDAKYQAKTAIDTFFFRAGDLLSTLTVFVGLRLFGEGRQPFVWTVFVLSLAMALVAWLIGREYARRHAARASAAGGLLPRLGGALPGQ